MQAEFSERLQVMVNRLGAFDLSWQVGIPFAWLKLPLGWRTYGFMRLAEERGVLLRAADQYAMIDGRAPHAVLADGRSTLDLFGQGFVLLQLRDQASDDNARNNASNIAALQAAAQSVGMPLQVRALQEPAVHSLYPHALVLVRPVK